MNETSRRRRNPPSMLLRTGAQLRDRVKARAKHEGIPPATWATMAVEERLRNPAPLAPSAPVVDASTCAHPGDLSFRSGPSTVCGACGTTLSLTG